MLTTAAPDFASRGSQSQLYGPDEHKTCTLQDAGGKADSMCRPHDPQMSWRLSFQNEQQMKAQFQPFAGTPHPSTSWAPSTGVYNASEAMHWNSYPLPQRSMSYSAAAGGGGQAQYMTMGQLRPVLGHPHLMADMYTSSAMGAAPLAPMETLPGNHAPMPSPLSLGQIPAHAQLLWSQSQQAQQYANRSPHAKDGSDYMLAGYGSGDGFAPHSGPTGP